MAKPAVKLPRWPGEEPRVRRFMDRLRELLKDGDVLDEDATYEVGGLIINGLNPNQLVSTDADRQLESADLADLVDGTTNQVIVTDDGDGTITLSTPQDIHASASPTFAGITLTGLTATRLMATDGSQAASSVSDLTTWIAGTTNQITVADDGDGTVTLSLPQNIHTGASPTFTGMTLSGLTANRLVATDGSSSMASVSDLTTWIAGTTNRVSVTDDTDGTVTLSAPQDLHEGATPTFSGYSIKGNRNLHVTTLNSATLTLGSHEWINVDYTDTGAVTISLPAASTAFDSSDSVGATYTIADTGFNSSVNNITIDPDGSDTIIQSGASDSETSVVIDVDGAVVRLMCISTTQWVVY